MIGRQTRERTAARWKGQHQHDLYVATVGKLMHESKNNQYDSSLTATVLSDGFPLELVETGEPIDEVHKWVRLVWRTTGKSLMTGFKEISRGAFSRREGATPEVKIAIHPERKISQGTGTISSGDGIGERHGAKVAARVCHRDEKVA